jgi:hypothetical protein
MAILGEDMVEDVKGVLVRKKERRRVFIWQPMGISFLIKPL